ncbi:MAG: DNA primase small subunit PriS [Thermofilum sp.]
MARALESLFKSYYRRTSIPPPPMVESREFGFQFFDSQSMLRHLAFSSGEELNRFLRERVPRHAYYSTALYEHPSVPDMSEKGWRGAEVVFDIDIDHVYTPCKDLHDSWKCLDCGAEGRGAPLKCPACGSEKLERSNWVCNLCINAAREEILKLLDFLELDFGINRKEMRVYFSGHRGFHLHVESEDVLPLEQDVRRELSDYVRGLGLDPETLLKRTRSGKYSLRYGVDAPGWPGRIAKYVALILAEDPSSRGGTPLELPLGAWKELISRAVDELGVKIDEKVTIDTRRLIRLPWTLHGKTGLRVVEFSVGELEAFTAEDLLGKAIVFSQEETRVRMPKRPKRVLFYELEEDGEVIRVPFYLAVYLHANGGAEILDWRPG